MPLVTINHSQAKVGANFMTSDLFTVQDGGRLSWRVPGRLKFNTLAVELNRTTLIDRLQLTTLHTPRLLFFWTLVQSSKSET